VSLPTTIDASRCCVPRITPSLTPEDAERTARVFKALGDPTRIRLLSLIAAGADGEACICDLTEPVGLSQGTVSHHMKLLADAGLVTREQRGKWAYFAINDGALEAAADALRSV
jgi:ArsR family transcriptional regulator